MKNLSRHEIIGVVTALVVGFGFLFFGRFIFSIGQDAPSNSDKSATVTAFSPSDKAEPFDKDDVLLGVGDEAKTGDRVSVHYTGMLVDGTVFDSSYGSGVPIEFILGSGEIIKGFDQGVIGMKIGGKRNITIPPELGYGSNAVGPIPANSTLIFEVELVAIGE